MSGDLTARNVIARAVEVGIDAAYGNSIYRWPQQEDIPPVADAVLAALAAAGWRLERDDHAADLNRMADGREQYLRGPARDPRTAADLAALSSDDLALWVEVQTWRSAARLVAGDREVLFSMPSWCWSDEMVRSLRQPGEVAPDA